MLIDRTLVRCVLDGKFLLVSTAHAGRGGWVGGLMFLWVPLPVRTPCQPASRALRFTTALTAPHAHTQSNVTLNFQHVPCHNP